MNASFVSFFLQHQSCRKISSIDMIGSGKAQTDHQFVKIV